VEPCPVYLNACRYPQRTAISWGGRSILWGAVNSYVHNTSRYLKEIAVHADTRILLVAEKSPSYFIVLMALWRIGALVCPLPPAALGPGPETIIADVNPGLVISSRTNKKIFSRNLRWTDIEHAVAYGYNDMFLGSDAALGPRIDTDRCLILRIVPARTLLSYPMLKADPGDLQNLFHCLETGDPLVIEEN